MEPKVSKHQQLDLYNNEEGKSLDKFEDEGEEENIGYISLPFFAPPQKKSNCPTNIGERTRSLNYLVYIPKIG